MHPREIIEALGVRAKLGGDRPETVIGWPPERTAAIAQDNDGVYVWVREDTVVAWVFAVHEALHVCLGDDTLDEESGLMAVEYAVMQETHEPFYSAWRDDFANYTLSWERNWRRGPSRVGHSNDFLKSSGWDDCVKYAHDQGWLHENRPIWGMGLYCHASAARFE